MIYLVQSVSICMLNVCVLGGQARWQSPTSTWFLRTAMSGTSAKTLDWHGVPSGYNFRMWSKYSGLAGFLFNIFVTTQVPEHISHGRIKDLPGGGPWRARGARAYNGGLGAEPPAGSRDRVPGEGSGDEAPEAESFSSIFIQKRGQKLSI